MNFFICDAISSNYEFHVVIGKYVLNYSCNNNISGRELVRIEQDKVILADSNISSHSEILGCRDISCLEQICKNHLTNGFVIFADLKEEKIVLVNDCYGFYSVFVSHEDSIIQRVSSSFEQLICGSKYELDLKAVLDVLLFNYTLLDRTMAKKVKRLQGGTELTYTGSGVTQRSQTNFAQNFVYSNGSQAADSVRFAQNLVQSLENELNDNAKTVLTLTGGFDSRLLLAAIINLGIPFSTITFGQEGNIEQVVADSIADALSLSHNEFSLDHSYVERIEDIAVEFIRHNLNNPVIQDLPHYLAMKNLFVGKNLVTGFMGGEMLSGQSVGAQVTYTEAAEFLLNATNSRELTDYIKAQIVKLPVLNPLVFAPHLDEYVNSLAVYFKTTGNENLVRYLCNEKYAKFFGTINNVFKDDVNLIVPNMSIEHLSYILSTKNSIVLNHWPNRLLKLLRNLKRKQVQAMAICGLAPQLRDSRLDRLYRVCDLCTPIGLLHTGIGYVTSHFIQANKKGFPRPHEYNIWLARMVVRTLSSLHPIKPLMQSNYEIDVNKYLNLDVIYQRKLINLMSVLISDDILSHRAMTDNQF